LKKLLSFNQSIPPETYFYSSRPKAENHLAPNLIKKKIIIAGFSKTYFSG